MANFISNAPQINDLQKFRSIIGMDDDLAKSARFAVRLNLGTTFAEQLVYLCETAEMPGRALNVDDARYYGPVFKTPYQSAYTELNLTFLCRSNMKEKELFDLWMEYINPKTTYDFQYRDNYAIDIDIFQYSLIAESDGKSKATYQQTLKEAYPIMVSPLPLAWAEDNFHRLQVTFTYTDWKKPDESNAASFDLVDAETIEGSILTTFKAI